MRPSGWRGGPESEASVVPPRPGLPIGDWIVLLACHLGIWADLGVARHSQRCSLGRAFVGKPVYEGPQVYEPNKFVTNLKSGNVVYKNIQVNGSVFVAFRLYV